ncbi:hypothetical protein [Acidisphaera sp. S103]|uniref:hypothetical protein n=1 Tax=Acidisphaera sp. S103 TaxID=1747223 RepID=UPI00131E4A55|nr:hypothetical protein [Acidisphaera sp. S103]
MTNAAKEWTEAGSFDTVTAAARRIREIEGRAEGGIFLSIYVEIDFGSDDEAFGHLEYTGKRALYVIKRRMN